MVTKWCLNFCYQSRSQSNIQGIKAWNVIFICESDFELPAADLGDMNNETFG